MAEDTTADATRRLNVKKQTLDDAYAAPANFLEIDVVNPVTTMGVGKKTLHGLRSSYEDEPASV